MTATWPLCGHWVKGSLFLQHSSHKSDVALLDHLGHMYISELMRDGQRNGEANSYYWLGDRGWVFVQQELNR